VLPGESSCGGLDLDLRTEATDPRSICTDLAGRGVIGLLRGGLEGAAEFCQGVADNYWMNFDNY